MKYRNYNAKRALPLMAFVAVAFATSCSNDGLTDGSSQSSASGKAETVELTASLNDDNSTDTRVGMTKEDDNKASFYWHKDEAILVQTVSGDSYSGVKFTTSAETGAATATFNGNISEDSLGSYAVYPYNENHKFTSATALAYYLPATYTYNKVESNVFSKTVESSTTYPVNSTNIPLVGEIKDGKIDFKHIGGLAVIRIEKMPAASGTLTVTADQQLSGDFTISDLSATEPMITTTTATTDADKTVNFTFSGASQGNAGVFYLPLATGSYSGVKIAVTCSGTTQTINYGNLYVARKSVVSVPLYATGTNGALTKFSKIDGNVYTLNGHNFIDLGLESGLLWAETNIGAETESDYGKYYAWGEVTAYNETTDWGSKEIKTNYEWSTYKYGTAIYSMTKYNETDSKEALEAEDDAATRNWGNGCRIPTRDECEKLYTTAGFTWTSVKEESDSLKGYRITGLTTGNTNSIFLPATGYRSEGEACNQLEYGYYWSSSRSSSSSYAYVLYFLSKQIDFKYIYNNYRCSGITVRPVAEK